MHKITITVLDFDNIGEDSIVDHIENTRYPNHCINPKVLKIESKEIGEWNDDHPLNKKETSEEYIERLFG